MPRIGLVLMVVAALVLATTFVIQAQGPARDPGPRGAPIGAGGYIKDLTADQIRFFNNGGTRFNSPDGVEEGLGPTFNGNDCGTCHSQPAEGGSSPSMNAFPNVGPNPQVALATLNGATNTVPFFVTPDGPVREARFKYMVSNGTMNPNVPDGGVHDLFTIAGRQDAQGCVYAQPDFNGAQAQNNLSLRIPTPTFGAGLIETIDDATILANMQANSRAKQVLGISGQPNRSANDGTITRFGWKAQNKSLLVFAGEAYNVEVGVSNELMPNKRGNGTTATIPSFCLYTATPNDTTNLLSNAVAGADDTQVPSDITAFATFMRFLDQPTPACRGKSCSASIQNGRRLFTEVVRCSLCHSPAMTTGNSSFTPSPDGKSTFGLSFVEAHLFSDLLVHHMGSGLADGISQGNAGPDQFRTAPLWGVGQRVFFLHDGRTSDLLQAIQQHKSPGSEANGVISLFNLLTEDQKQDLLNFLRSL